MSDYLENLAARASEKHNFLQPRVPSLFEPAFRQELLSSTIAPAEDAFRIRPAAQSRSASIESPDLKAYAVRLEDMPLANLPIRTKVRPDEAAFEKNDHSLKEESMAADNSGRSDIQSQSTIDDNILNSIGPKNAARNQIADSNKGIAPLESDRIDKDPEELAGKSAPNALRDENYSGENRRADDYQSDEAKPPAIGKNDGAMGLDYGNLHDALSQYSPVENSQQTGHLKQMGNPPQRGHHQQTENSEKIFSKIEKSNLQSNISEESTENGRNMEIGTEKRRALGSRLMEPNFMGSFRQNENSVLPGERPVSRPGLMHDTIESSPAFEIEQPKKLQKTIVAPQEQSGQTQPSIKVTIGRIEVRAVKTPEKREAKKAINQPSSSLDEYLASLRGRSR
jgi:hypothetical protein